MHEPKVIGMREGRWVYLPRVESNTFLLDTQRPSTNTGTSEVISTLWTMLFNIKSGYYPTTTGEWVERGCYFEKNASYTHSVVFREKS